MHKAAARQACLAPFASFRPFVCMTPALAVVYNFSSSSLILMSLHLRHFILPAIGSLALFGATVAAPQTPPSSATNIPQKAVASSRIPPAPARKQAVKNKRQPPKASLAQPAPPPPPPTLEQMPASPPQVSFQNGQLSIAARNSTLADILSAVQRTTGAAVDAPPSAARERVVADLGPAPANDVLASLLSGSRFDYIILGAPTGVGGLQRIILTLRQSISPSAPGLDMATTTPSSATGTTAPGISSRPGPAAVPEVVGDEEEEPEPSPVPAQRGAPQQPPALQQSPVNPSQSGSVKTPQELLEELQRMQKQQGMQPPQGSVPPSYPPLVAPQQPPPQPPK